MAAALADAARGHNGATATVPGRAASGWRNVVSGNQHKTYLDAAGHEHRVTYRFIRDGLVLPDDDGVSLVSARRPGGAR